MKTRLWPVKPPTRTVCRHLKKSFFNPCKSRRGRWMIQAQWRPRCLTFNGRLSFLQRRETSRRKGGSSRGPLVSRGRPSRLRTGTLPVASGGSRVSEDGRARDKETSGLRALTSSAGFEPGVLRYRLRSPADMETYTNRRRDRRKDYPKYHPFTCFVRWGWGPEH